MKPFSPSTMTPERFADAVPTGTASQAIASSSVSGGSTATGRR